MRDKKAIYNRVHELLDKAGLPVSFQSEIITRMTEETGYRYDMSLKADILENMTRVYLYERGSVVFEAFIMTDLLVEYLMIREAVEVYYNVLASMEHVSDDGYIDMKWESEAKEAAFEKMGEPYRTMYANNISIYNINNVKGKEDYE